MKCVCERVHNIIEGFDVVCECGQTTYWSDIVAKKPGLMLPRHRMRMAEVELLNKSYCGESMVDSERDVLEAWTAASQIPVDDYGFHKGSFRVTVTWYHEETE